MEIKILKKMGIIILILCFFAVGTNANGETRFTFMQNLTLGIRGSDVSTLQQFLIAGGFLNIPTSTGYFGLFTKTALSAWQKSAGVFPSVGFFGPISRERINAIAQQAPVNATTTNVSGSPVRLKIPKLNIDAGFQYTGLTPDGVMEIPNNITDVGWFTGSPLPGEKGSAIITGHVAQIRGGILTKPGVFSNLSELQAGDKLYIVNDRGESITFVVRESRSYDPAADATNVFASKDGGAHLNLITCEGTWNPAQLSYSQRLVVFTDAVQ